ncbi:MAG: hypothetical protein RIF37_01370 [Rhodospirillaceae bacterium]|jgi:hypothetical protein
MTSKQLQALDGEDLEDHFGSLRVRPMDASQGLDEIAIGRYTRRTL